MRLVVIAFAALGLAFVSPAHAGEGAGGASFEPRNECRGDPGAAAFLDALAAAVDARDSAALVALAADDVHLDFGGGEGRDELRARLDGGEEYYGDLWRELSAVLSLGCASDGDGFITLPWYFAQNFEVLDPFSTMLTIRPDVKVRATPSGEGKLVATLNWDPVELAESHDPEVAFVEVILPDRSRGYVETAALRSLIDYRLVAEKTDEGWRISAFVAGD